LSAARASPYDGEIFGFAPNPASTEGAGAPAAEPRTRRRITRNQTFINGLGTFHPERRVTNVDLMQTMDTSDEWIRDHTGIVERRYADDEVNTSDLGVLALSRALEDARMEPDELDVVICSSSTPDALAPVTASYIANKLGLRAVAFDVNAACSGFIYGLAVGRGMLHTQGNTRIAVVAADKFTRVIDPEDRANSIFWGDSAGAAIIQPEAPSVGLEVVDVTLSAHNQGADLVRVPVRGYFEMHGRAVKKIAFQGMVDSATETLERNDVSVSDLRGFSCHQANLRLVDALAERLGVEPHQSWHNVEMFGNQGAPSVLTAFCHGLERNVQDLRDGDLFLLTVYGSGFTSGSALLRWVGGDHSA
jgi:3-oxoacyl-[acyl-carrier-protein] synthase-3